MAAVGAAGVAAANASPQILRQLRGQPATMSGQLPANMCFENSGYTPISQFDVKGDGTGQGTYFVWFSVQDLPAGTYTFTLTPDPGAPPPFEYNDPGNNVFTFEADKNITAPVCPDLAWWNAHTPTKSTHAISGVGGAFPYQLNSESAFLVKVHID